MEKKKQRDKASVHSGRANSKGVAYNANHNTMEEARSNQPHIDQDRIKLNVNIQYNGDGTQTRHKGGAGGFDSRKHEMDRYKQLYGEGLGARNERYVKSGHKDRAKKLSQVYRDPKTAPMETIFQLGKKGSETDSLTRAKVMAAAWNETLEHLRSKYGENLIPLTSSLHRDEVNDHIHFRFTLGARDKFGHFVPNQNQALEAMGFKPEPGKARGRYNNPLVAFTDELRETFYRACERRGIEIDREVTSGSRRQLELMAQKCQGLQNEIEAHQRAIAEGKKALDSLDFQLLMAGAEKDEIARASQEAQEALKRAQDETLSLEQQITALRAAQAALEAQNKHLSDYKSKLDKRLAEVTEQGKAIVAENGQLKEANEQLRAENKQLQDDRDKLDLQIMTTEMEKEQLQMEVRQLQSETAQAKADRAAALEAAQEMEKHQRELFARQNIRKLTEYETIPAQKEKKNFRGQVTQEARPECVIVAKAELEKIKEQAQYKVTVDYTEATMAKLDKKISENEIIQGLQAQVQQQQMEMLQLRGENSRLTQQKQRDDWTIEQLEQTLGAYGIPSPLQQQQHQRHRHR